MSNIIKLGNLDISAFKVGSADCKVYLGDTLLYSGGTTPPTPTPTAFTWVTADTNFSLGTPIYGISANTDDQAAGVSPIRLEDDGGTQYEFYVFYVSETDSSSYVLNQGFTTLDSGTGTYCDLYSVLGKPLYLRDIPSNNECINWQCIEECEDPETGERWCCNEECEEYATYYPFNVKISSN